jgi:hypothetical protein
MDHGDSGRAVAHDGRPFGRARKGEVDWVRPAGWWRRSSTLAGVRSIGNGIPQRRRRCRGVHFLPDRRQSQTNFAGLLTVRVNAIAKCDPFLAEWVPRCLALQPNPRADGSGVGTPAALARNHLEGTMCPFPLDRRADPHPDPPRTGRRPGRSQATRPAISERTAKSHRRPIGLLCARLRSPLAAPVAGSAATAPALSTVAGQELPASTPCGGADRV